MSNSPLPSERVKIAAGSIISSKSTDYFVESLLGEGTFGKVAKCTRMDNHKTVAIKLMKGDEFIVSLAKDEEDILSELKSLDPDSCNIVRWYGAFCFDGHSCLEFEHLDQSLQDFWKESHKQPLLIKEIRPIVQQVANALSHLKSLKIIHSDLKRENIMLVNHKEEPFKVKLIDFGVAFKEKEASVGSYIQPRVYRAPEILLGLPYTAAIDMWSLGILAATLFLGSFLYPGRNGYDMLRYITDTQGQLPNDLLELAEKTKNFYNWDLETRQWKLKTPRQFRKETSIKPKERRAFMMSSLDDLLIIPPHVHMDHTDIAEVSDHLMFVDMLKKMLNLDAAERITPRQLLKHPFISMSRMESMRSVNSYVKSCYRLMRVCNLPGTSHGEDDASESLQLEVSKTPPPPPPPPTESPSLCQFHFISSSPSTCAQPMSAVKPGTKRKLCNDDENPRENSHHKKRKLEPHRFDDRHSSKFQKPESCRTKDFERRGKKREMAGKQEQIQPTNSEHKQHKEEVTKRKRVGYEGPSTSDGSGGTQKDNSQRVHQKVTEANDSHTHCYGRSDLKRRCYEGVANDSGHCSSNHSSHPAEHHHHGNHHTSGTQTNLWVRSGRKRRAADHWDDEVRSSKRPSDPWSQNEDSVKVVISAEGKKDRPCKKVTQMRSEEAGSDQR